MPASTALRRATRAATAVLVLVAGLTCATPATEAASTRSTPRPRPANGLIAYVSDRDSPAAQDPTDEVYLLEPGSRRVFRMTTDPAVEAWPTLSADGRQLAWVRLPIDSDGYTRFDQAQLWTCTVAHRHRSWSCRQPRQLVSLVTYNAIALSADGRSVYYSGARTAPPTSTSTPSGCEASAPRSI